MSTYQVKGITGEDCQSLVKARNPEAAVRTALFNLYGHRKQTDQYIVRDADVVQDGYAIVNVTHRGATRQVRVREQS